MATAIINGITLSVRNDTLDRDDLEIGEGFARAFDGSLQRSTRGYKRQWSLSTPPDLPATIDALVQYLQGRGEHWDFATDLYGDQGNGPSASSGATSVAGGLFGNALQLAATTGSITYAGLFGVTSPGGATGATLLVQRKESGVWHDYALVWSAAGTLTAVYKDGVAQAVALPSWVAFTYSTGTIVLSNTAGAVQLFDELVVLPFAAPTAWLAPWATWRATNAWSLMPALTLTGDIGSATVDGKTGKVKASQGAVGGVFSPNLETLQFELWEA